MFDGLSDTRLRRALAVTVFLAVAAAVHFTAKQSSLYVDLELISMGEIAPDFKLRRLDSRSYRLSALYGDVVWIIFGRTDDDGSVIQLQEARKVAEKYREQGLRILFLAQSQGFEEVEKFVQEHGSAGAMMFDVGGRVAKRYHARHWPTSYVLDKTGRIEGGRRGVWRASNSALNRILQETLRSGTRSTPVPVPAPAGEGS